MSRAAISCPESVIGAHQPDRAGRCRWCGVKSSNAVPAPERMPISEDTQAYRYFFDPDFGADKRDVYGCGPGARGLLHAAIFCAAAYVIVIALIALAT